MKYSTILPLAYAVAKVSAAAVSPRVESLAAPNLPCGITNVMVLVFENEDESSVLSDPYFSSLLPQGYFLSSYNGVAHPSEPNYVAMISGSTHGITDDGNYNLNGNSIVDLLEAKGLTWKAYQENYPGNCYASDSNDLLYRRKHNPFISFNNIRNNAARCAKIVNAKQLDTDASSGKLPNYAFFTPNMNDDGHDTNIPTASAWLKKFLTPKLSNPAYNSTLFWITFDESATHSMNHIYTVLVGQGIKGKGLTDSTSYNHYSQLATIEKIFGLGNLGQNDVQANLVPLAHC